MRRIFNFSKDFGHELGAVVCDALGEDAGVNLRGVDVAVPEHSGKRLDRHPVGECDGSGEGVARHVGGEGLAEAEAALDLVEVGVGALVGDEGQAAAVAAQYGLGRGEQGREEARAGLVARGVDEARAGALDDVEELDELAVGVGEAGIGAEYK